jgi:[ribosomal protein S5]-alanine N-acetyltransferase
VKATEPDERVLQVEDLRLRPWTVDDVDVVISAFADPSIRHYAGNLYDTADEATRFVTTRSASWAQGTGAAWAITAAETGTVLGHVGLHEMDAGLRLAMIGYWLLPRARGRGVMTRAIGPVSAYAFESLGLHRIELAHAVENEASCRVAERAGYVYEGTLRQAMRYPVDGRWSDEHLHARLATDGQSP